MVKKIQDRVLQTKYVFAMGITDSTIAQEIEKIREFNPKIIRNYASHMYTMAKLMEKNDIRYQGATVATTGSMLFPQYRTVIEKQFNCKVFDAYGGESTAVSFECEEHNGYHISDEDVIVEFLKEGEQVVPGERGRIVFTNLDNFAMPVIQDTLDHLTVKIIKNQQFTDDELHHIRNEIQKRAGPDVRLTIEFVQDIPVYGRGSKRKTGPSQLPFKKKPVQKN